MSKHFTHAIVRRPGWDAGQGLTTAGLGAPDINRLIAQHAAYLGALRAAGLDVTTLEPLPGFPDAYFVEDAALITPEVTILTRPGAGFRRGEIPALERHLIFERPLAYIRAPATLEGGDVFVWEKRVFAGLSARTNRSGLRQLIEILGPYGYTVTGVEVKDGLHLKSSVNLAAENTLLLTPEYAGRDEFAAFGQIQVDPQEAYAANVLYLGDHLLVPSGFPRTRARLETLGLDILELDVSEVRKMDGGLTCMSLRF